MRLRLLLFAALALGSLLALPHPTQAANGANFDPGRIIDDSVFTNYTAMSAGDIQNFLNAKMPSCDTNGAKTSEYGGGTRAQYGTAHGNPPPYICLRDYSQNGLSAAQIIYSKAQEWRINPQVMLVLLQKEQRLISDDWPWAIQYRSATGYGCPDTAACDSTYYGFTNQVNQADRMFRLIMDNARSNYYPVGYNNVLWSPNTACGTSSIYIGNRGTSALYNYTPYRPNQAALNNLYGSGDSCSAYGNRNFWRDFTDWFGSTTGDQRTYAYTAQVPGNPTVYLVDGSTKYAIPDPETFSAYGLQWGSVRYVDQATLDSYTTGRVLTTWATGASGGAIYLLDQGQKRTFPDFSTYSQWGGNAGGRVITFSDAFLATFGTGPTVTQLARTADGSVYFVSSGTKRPFPDMTTFNALGYNWGSVVNYTPLITGQLAAGALMLRDYVGVMLSGDATVFRLDGTNRWPVTGEAFGAWGMNWGDVYQIDQLTSQAYPLAGGPLPLLVKDSGGQGYLISGGSRRPVPTSWGVTSGVYPTSPSDGLINSLPLGPSATNLLRSPDGSVYFITGGQKRPILDPTTFALAGFSWSQVINVPSGVTAQIPTGPVVLPDGITINPAGAGSFFLMDQGKRIAIPNPSVFNAWGLDWNAYRPDQTSADAYALASPALGYFASDPAHSNVFALDGGRKYFFPNDATFLAYGVSSTLSTVSRWIIDGRPTGGVLTRFVQGSGFTVYYMKNGQKQPISSPSSLFALGGSWESITHLSDPILQTLPTGPTATTP